MGQILLAGEEPQERPAMPGDVVADRPAKHWITGLERVEDRALGDRTLDAEFHFSIRVPASEDVLGAPLGSWPCTEE